MVELLRALGLSGDETVVPLRGGRNNRVWRVEVAAGTGTGGRPQTPLCPPSERGEDLALAGDGASPLKPPSQSGEDPPLAGDGTYLLKQYFHHPADPRDRLATEYAFLTFAHAAGVTACPRPVARSDAHHAALYEWIDGRPLQPVEIGAEAVTQALDFYRALNAGRERASELPPVSEAAFTIAEHLALVDRRVARLDRLAPADELRVEAAAVADAVRSTWAPVRAATEPDGQPVPPDERCVSPSDFGFHNALVEPSGRLRFLDFEYAGWDEPARMVCDFFCQPDGPVPEALRPLVIDAALDGWPSAEAHRRRIALLQPVYTIKWCCILLNDLLPVDAARREFSGRAPDAARQAEQLRRARAMLARLHEG